MIRTPLRPLARILSARQKGQDPDEIEAELRARRHAEIQDRARRRAEGRLRWMVLGFVLAFGTVGVKMGTLASSQPVEPRAQTSGAQIMSQRADIVDRRGRVLATNLSTHALYAHPRDLVDPETAAAKLAKIFPDLDAKRLRADLTGSASSSGSRRRSAPSRCRPSTTSASRGWSSARARCGFTPTGGSPATSSAVRSSATRA